MATNSKKHVHRSPDERAGKPDAGPERSNWGDQELTDNGDQHRQEDELRRAGGQEAIGLQSEGAAIVAAAAPVQGREAALHILSGQDRLHTPL